MGVPGTHSAEITLAWAPNNEPDLSGYMVFCRQNGQSYDYNDPIWEGDKTETSCTVYGLDDNIGYCFVVRAFDTSGNESGNSNEACWQSSAAPAMLQSLSISGPDSVSEASTANYAATARFSDGSSEPATNSSHWSENSSYASISDNGVLTASLVPSGQTVTITASYTFANVTRTAQKTLTITDISESNRPPQQPIIISPYHGQADAPLTPELCTGRFFDPDGDAHGRTRWQISGKLNDFSEGSLVFGADTDSHLTSLIVPRSVLDEETTYYWRVRFYDSKNSGSEWSDICSFRTLFTGYDIDPRNGVSDDQEVDGTSDLDGDGTADINQGDIKCVNTVVGNEQIGVKTGQNVVAVESVESIDPETLRGTVGRPDEMPFGAIGFKLSVGNPGDNAEVTIYLSEPAPGDAQWYKYDSVNGWQANELRILSVFSDDRRSVTLLLEDGDYGDADGVQNGIIVDPGAIGLSYASDGDDTDGDGGSGVGGCFISVTAFMMDALADLRESIYP